MKNCKKISKLILLGLMGIYLVSCGSNKSNNSYQNALTGGAYGYGNGTVTASGSVLVNNSSDLLGYLQKGLATDLAFMQNGGQVACLYSLQSGSGGIINIDVMNSYIRIFKLKNGAIGYDTYRPKLVTFNASSFEDIIGNQLTDSNMSGTISSGFFDSYFQGVNSNIQIGRTQQYFQPFGMITIYIVPSPYGTMGYSLDIPAVANTIPSGKQWCRI